MTTKTDRQKTVDRLDALYRDFIRLRGMKLVGGCQRCGRPKPSHKCLDTAHCHGCGRYTTRWDPRNALALCGACHMLIDAQISEKEALFRKLLGDEEYERLYILANMSSKQSPIDYKLTELYLKEEIRRLDG